MLMAPIPAAEAYRQACGRQPLLCQDSPSQRPVALYGWRVGPTREVHIAKAQELVLSVHLDGAQRVRVFTEEGWSRSFSKPGDLTLIPSGKAVRYRTEGGVDFATLHFPANRLREDVSRTLARAQTCLFAFPDDYIIASVRRLMQIARAPAETREPYLAAVFDALALHIAQVVEDGEARGASLVEISQTAMPGPAFDKVLEQIETQLAENLTLKDLADTAGVCRTTFAEQFAKRFGASPHRYITQRRVERARTLLTEGRLSITDIAYEVGFGGQSHFSTTFRAYTGTTPSAYQRKNLRRRSA